MGQRLFVHALLTCLKHAGCFYLQFGGNVTHTWRRTGTHHAGGRNVGSSARRRHRHTGGYAHIGGHMRRRSAVLYTHTAMRTRGEIQKEKIYTNA